MEWQVKLLKAVCQCSSQFVFRSIVRVPECVSALLRQTRCSDDFFGATCVSFAGNFSEHINDSHFFVALKVDWIEETVSFKMSQDFLRQVLITTFSSTHEADDHSTARFHTCNAWLSFALCHCSNEHVVCLEFRQSIRRPVHYHSSVRRTSSATRNKEKAPISEWNVCRVVCHPRSVCGWVRSAQCSCSSPFTSNVKLSRLSASAIALHRCRRLPCSRHFPKFPQPSPSLCEVGFHLPE